MCLEAIKGCLPTPGSGLHDERHATTGEDELFAVAAGERAVAIHVAWLSWQDGRYQSGIVHIRGGHFHSLDQGRVLIRCNMRLIPMYRLAATMACPSCVTVLLNAGRRYECGIDQCTRAHHYAFRLQLFR